MSGVAPQETGQPIGDESSTESSQASAAFGPVEKLVKLMGHFLVNQTALASAIGTTPQVVNKILAGERKLTTKFAEKVSRAFSLESASWFFDGRDSVIQLRTVLGPWREKPTDSGRTEMSVRVAGVIVTLECAYTEKEVQLKPGGYTLNLNVADQFMSLSVELASEAES